MSHAFACRRLAKNIAANFAKTQDRKRRKSPAIAAIRHAPINDE
jgi:hypothetical protein